MPPIADEHPEYWHEYTNIQRVKHALLKRYLEGWFPKLSWAGRVIYIDTHAGRGTYASGASGSPLVALNALLKHRAKTHILKQSEVVFLFIEADDENKKALELRIAELGQLPSRIKWKVICDDYEKAIQGIIDDIRKQNAVLAPSFVFVDPYTFKLPLSLLAQLISFPRCELFINFMWRYVDMALHNPAHEANMDALFGKHVWQSLRVIEDPDQRCEAAIQLLRLGLKAKYITRIRMLGTIQYVLLHATNHSKGRELMKDSMWALCPTGEFVARVSDNVAQQYLFKPGFELDPLKAWLVKIYGNKSVRVHDIYPALDDLPYLKPHLHKVLRELLEGGKITCSEPLVFARNPRVVFHASGKASN